VDANLNQRGRLSLAAEQPNMMRRRNISAIMRTVLANGPLSRTQIAEQTGLSPGGVTKLTAALISARLLREIELPSDATVLGRPRVPVEIDNRSHVVAALHIGTQFTTVGLVDLAGKLVYQELFPREGTRPSEVVRDAKRFMQRIVRQHARNSNVIGLGAAIGGWIDTERAGFGWRNVELREMLVEAFAWPLRLDATVRAMALAEGWFGTAVGSQNLVQIFVGNVVGAAISVDYTIQRGPQSAAGDLTHLPIRGMRGNRLCACGHNNCLQVVGSDLAVIEAARKRKVVAPGAILKDVIEAARTGDRVAVSLLRNRARAVGQAVALIFELINPDVAVLNGGIIHALEYLTDLRNAVAENLQREIDLERRILPSVLGEDAFPIAPAATLLVEYYRDPMAFQPLLSLAE